ncbi:hypothetical protein E5675_19370 [Sphingopyxis sp. PAMC25046]|uniref:hypothetical protein n=1 Tax=Sphingopyxis sp. PAMC25046 TaxID=2565556 RepID=UPI00109DEBF2|nr:hypothetical protein [Sphingopyxis sp. PAMC25046]QCB56377.1 hypothetical protein E5675_19370 [Sphingopyxis sp. PAMC25046]
MGPFEMVIGIVLIVTIGSIVRTKHGIRRDRHGNDYVAGNDAETKALQAEIRALKDRIQVLERIATDNNRAVTLDQEIEKLRDSSKI